MLRFSVLQLSLVAYYPLLHSHEACSIESDDDHRDRSCEQMSLLQTSLKLASPAKANRAPTVVGGINGAATSTADDTDSVVNSVFEETTSTLYPTSTTETDSEETTAESTTTSAELGYADLGNLTDDDILPDNGVDPTDFDGVEGVAAERDAAEKASLKNSSSPLQTPVSSADVNGTVSVAPAPFNPPAPAQDSLLDGAMVQNTTTTRPPLVLATSTTTTTTFAVPYSQGNGTENITVPVAPKVEPLPNLTAEEMSGLNESRAQAQLDCRVTEWTEWSDCGVLNTGLQDGIHGKLQQRERIIVTPQSLGGAACPDLVQEKSCDDDDVDKKRAGTTSQEPGD